MDASLMLRSNNGVPVVASARYMRTSKHGCADHFLRLGPAPCAADILCNGTLSVSRSASSTAQTPPSAPDPQNAALIPTDCLLYGQLLGLGSPQRHSERQAHRELEIGSIRRQPHAKAQIERPPPRIKI